jgi:hypothetical protein
MYIIVSPYPTLLLERDIISIVHGDASQLQAVLMTFGFVLLVAMIGSPSLNLNQKTAIPLLQRDLVCPSHLLDVLLLRIALQVHAAQHKLQSSM